MLWNADVCFAFVSDVYLSLWSASYFSLSFSGRITGTRAVLRHSFGADVDKAAAAGPRFLTRRRRITSVQYRGYLPKDLLSILTLGVSSIPIKSHYQQKDYHRMYVGEVVKVLKDRVKQ